MCIYSPQNIHKHAEIVTEGKHLGIPPPEFNDEYNNSSEQDSEATTGSLDLSIYKFSSGGGAHLTLFFDD